MYHNEHRPPSQKAYQKCAPGYCFKNNQSIVLPLFYLKSRARGNSSTHATQKEVFGGVAKKALGRYYFRLELSRTVLWNKGTGLIKIYLYARRPFCSLWKKLPESWSLLVFLVCPVWEAHIHGYCIFQS